MVRADVVLRRPPQKRGILHGAISEWDLVERRTGSIVGLLARDDAKWCGIEYGPGLRYLWHAWLPDCLEEALPVRFATREDAVDALLVELSS